MAQWLSIYLPPWPGFDSWTRRHMWLSLLLVLVLASRGFSPGTPVSPSPQKPTFLNSNSIWIIVKNFIMSLDLSREIAQVLPVLLLNKLQ